MPAARNTSARKINFVVLTVQIALDSLATGGGLWESDYEDIQRTLTEALPIIEEEALKHPAHPIYGPMAERIREIVTPKRYRYERYTYENGKNDWERRVQWLVFDRHGVGCMMSIGDERSAALTVAALNAFTLTEDADAFQPEAWHNRVREERIADGAAR